MISNVCIALIQLSITESELIHKVGGGDQTGASKHPEVVRVLPRLDPNSTYDATCCKSSSPNKNTSSLNPDAAKTTSIQEVKDAGHSTVSSISRSQPVLFNRNKSNQTCSNLHLLSSAPTSTHSLLIANRSNPRSSFYQPGLSEPNLDSDSTALDPAGEPDKDNEDDEGDVLLSKTDHTSLECLLADEETVKDFESSDSESVSRSGMQKDSETSWCLDLID